jgi:hypothetical protein
LPPWPFYFAKKVIFSLMTANQAGDNATFAGVPFSSLVLPALANAI